MNYTNNIDKYYVQAHYNNVKEKETNRNKMLWLLLLIGILLSGLFFLYKSYQFNEVINDYGNSETEKSNVKNTSTATITVPQEVTPTKTIVKKVESTPVMASSAVDTAIEKLDVVESQKLSESKIETVLASKVLRTKEDATVVVEKTSLPETGKLNSTSLEKSNLAVESLNKDQGLVALDTTEKEKSAISTSVAKVSDANLSKALPIEMFHLYIISKGETIYSIALKQYNDRAMYQKIIEANPDLENPNSIREGQEILLPIINEQKAYSDILNFR